jgi:ring-1,2-phenylacetyl-CoA epoxidase subunit PaaE
MQINQIQVRIKSIKQETADARSYTLEEISGRRINYKAGQFITLLLNINGREVRRSYSLTSAPGIDKDLTITIKRVENGIASRYIIDHFKAGQIISCIEPTGRFVVEDETSTLFFIVAGSGITPVFSMIKYVLKFHPTQQIILINQNRSKESAMFSGSLQALSNSHPGRLTIVDLFSQPAGSTFGSRLNNYLLEQLVTKYAPDNNVHFYICGPKAFMLMSEVTLKVLGYWATATR